MKPIKILDVGSDIELFLQHKQTGEIISAEGYIQGTKDDPYNFDLTSRYFATSLDNVLAEFCIPPAKTAEEFYEYVTKSMGYINGIIPPEYRAVPIPSATLDERWLQTMQSRVFGCEPDFNAYTGDVNHMGASSNTNLRSAGLHVHVGYEAAEQFDMYRYKGDNVRCNLIKAMDLFLGIPAVIMEPDNERKQLYGKAGAFRPKPYGVEYRTLSNHFVSSKEKIMWVHNATMQAADWINSGNIVEKQLADIIIATINNSNKPQAEQLIKDFNLQTV